MAAVAAVVLLCGCASSGKAAKGNEGGKSGATGRYERKAIVERNEEQLKNEAMMIEAKMKQEAGLNEQAETILRHILARDPQNAAACYELSRILIGKNMSDSAIVYAQRAERTDEANVWYAQHLAALYKHTNQPRQYAAEWEKIVSHHSDVIEYYYELSNAYLLCDDYKNAIAALNRVEKRVGVTEAVSLQKAKIWSHAGNEAKALQEIEALVRVMPQESRYNGILAESYMASKQYRKAKECYDRVLASNPDDEYIHISLAEYYKATGEPRKAYEELRIGMAQNSLSTANKLQVLTNFYTSEEFYGTQSKYAFDLLDVVMRNSDDSTSYAAFYGDVLMRQREYEAASRQFRLALTRDSSKYDVWEALLVSELSAYSDTALMAAHARRASRLFPLHSLPYYILAVVEHDNGRYSRALDLARKCEEMGFDKGYLEAETYMMLAECYNRLDDSQCYEYFEKTLKLDPDNLQVLNSYAYRLALDKKDLEKAEQMSRKTIVAEPQNHHFLDTYAWILHQMGRDREALKYMEKVMKSGEASDEERMHWEEIKRRTEN